MKLLKRTLFLTLVLSATYTTVFAKKIIVTDLGPHPILILLCTCIIGAIIWFIGYNLQDNTDSGCLGETFGYILTRLGATLGIGGLISIPINLLFMGYWWIILILIAIFFIAVYIINKLD